MPKADDRYFVEGIDISLNFYDFQKHVRGMINSNPLFVETHVHHLLAMSSILLLRPRCIHQDLKKFLDIGTRQAAIKKVKTDLQLEGKAFNKVLKQKIMDIIEDVRRLRISKKKGLMLLYSLDEEATELENKIIFSIGAMMMKLPDEALMDDIKEMELITRYLDPALQPLFDDLDNDILFRWSNTISTQAKTPTAMNISKRRPDASIDVAEGIYIQRSYGFGEVKSGTESKNHYALSRDLIRLGVFSQNAIDAANLKGVLSFQAIGNQVTFFITKLVADGLYIMVEIGFIDVPCSLRELASYTVHLNDVLNIINAFYGECGDSTTPEERTDVEARTRPTMKTPEMDRIVDTTRSRKRPCSTAYYRH
ncbi:unnamed protein product [Absidia cylindrospora]